MDTANSEKLLKRLILRTTPSYLFIKLAESVETLHGEAEMPKRKSGRQAQLSGQGNLMSEAKQRVACSSHARRTTFQKYTEKTFGV